MSEKQQTLVKKSKILEFYETKYKILMIIPFILLAAAIIQIGYQTATTGDFINKGVSLKGGVIITLNQYADPGEIESLLKKQLPDSDVTTTVLAQRGLNEGLSITIDIDPQNSDHVKLVESTLSNYLGVSESEIRANIQTITSQFSANFYQAVIRALLLAFFFMGIVVFLYFRTIAPSLAVILAAASDIIVTLAIVNLLGIKLSSAGIAAFLMLIGYSVDTDILLTTKVLKNKRGTVTDRVINSMKTGVMMNVTTLAALTAALTFAISEDIRQIMIILIIGLIVDNVNTWIQNVGILRYYLERKRSKHGKS